MSLSLRCSSLPLAFTCPGSVRPPTLRIEEANAAADLGTAVHDVMRRLVNDGVTVGGLDLRVIAQQHGVSESELRPLSWYGAKAWDEIRGTMPDAVAELGHEIHFEEFSLSGHLDVMAESGETAAVVDFKTGRKDKDHYHQLMGYCLLTFDKHPAVMTIYASVVWIRDQEIETVTVTREAFNEWFAELTSDVVEWDGAYRTGQHCVYCPRSHECPAMIEAMRRDVSVISALPMDLDAGLAGLPAPERVAIFRRAKAITAVCERVIGAVRTNVALSGGLLDAEDGMVLRLHTEGAGRKIDALKAFPILQNVLNDEELASCLDVRISRVEQIVAKNAGRGNGASAKRVLNEKLEAAEAVTRATREVLEEVRKEKSQ